MKSGASKSDPIKQRTRNLDPAPWVILALCAGIWAICPSIKPHQKALRNYPPPKISWISGLSAPVSQLIAPFGLPSKMGFSLPEETAVDLQDLLRVPEMSPHFLPLSDPAFLKPRAAPLSATAFRQKQIPFPPPITPAFSFNANIPREGHLLVEPDPSLSAAGFALENLSEEDLKQFDKSFHVVIYVEMSSEGRLANAWVEASSGNPSVDIAVVRLLERSRTQKMGKTASGRVSVSYYAP